MQFPVSLQPMRRYILVMTAFLRPVLILLVALLPLTGCGEVPARKPDARILMMEEKEREKKRRKMEQEEEC